MALEDVLASKLLALADHNLDLEPALQMARSLREQIDWDQVRARTDRSPYAKAFFTLVEELGIARTHPDQGRARVRVLEAAET
jgi:hypothetical protein